VIKIKIIASSITSVINLPLKKANICTKNAVFVGVATLNTHFLETGKRSLRSLFYTRFLAI